MVRFKSVESITEKFVGTPFTVCDAVGTGVEGTVADKGEGEATDIKKVGGQAIIIPDITRLRQRRLRRMRCDILSAMSGLAEMGSERLKLSPIGAARSMLAGRKRAESRVKAGVSMAITVA